jgi:hypothetical protein
MWLLRGARQVDLLDKAALHAVFREYGPFHGCVHFAAFKVGTHRISCLLITTARSRIRWMLQKRPA